MADFDPKYAKEKIINKSDEELVLIAGSTTDDYLQEVIDYAKEELQKRGAENLSASKAQEIIEQREVELGYSSMEKGFPIRWLTFYIFVRLPVGLAFSAMSLVINVTFVSIAIASPLILLSIIVFIGLRKRSLWGWKLNWVLLCMEAISMILSAHAIGLVLAVLWLITNGIYFNKRRILFS